ncbi:MAG: hypothetical protein Q9183_006292, partial [Haloplaca sp. 2 TL-2023]
ADFNEYKNRTAEDDIPWPTKPQLASKINDINKLLNHSFTPEELQQKLERSGMHQSRFDEIERASILDNRRKAEFRGDETAVAKWNAKLAELEGPKLAFGTSLYKEPPKAENTEPTQQERLAALNRANRKANTEDVRKAQREEKKAAAIARRAVERGEAVADSFARVKTRPRVNYDSNGEHLAPPKPATKALDDLFDDGSKNNSGNTTPARSGTPMQNGAVKKSSTPQPPHEKINGMPRIGKRNMDDDVIAAMDLGIEIDI